MRSAWLALLVLLPGALAGCTGPSGNPNLNPPCADTRPLRIDIQVDRERYLPGQLMNVTLTLDNQGDRAQTVRFRSWELSMRAFDGRYIRIYTREQDPDLGGATRSVAANGKAALQERFQPFRVTSELFQPLTPGTYYICAVITGVDGSTVAQGARPFIAEPPQRNL
jgi:hypothetical protein